MKSTIKYLGMVFSAILLLASCEENTVPLFNVEDSFLQIENKAYTIAESDPSSTALIVIHLASTPASEDIKIAFEVSGKEYGEKGAQEGVDYEIVSPNGKSSTITKGSNSSTIVIRPIDNDEFTGNKFFDIKITENSASLNMEVDGMNMATITIEDDDNPPYPIDVFLGEFSETETELDGTVGTSTDLEIKEIPGSDTTLQIVNFWDGGQEILADLDLAKGIISIKANQVIYVHSTYGDCKAVRIDLGAGVNDPLGDIEGRIQEDGSIVFEAWSALVEAGSFGNYAKTVLTR